MRSKMYYIKLMKWNIKNEIDKINVKIKNWQNWKLPKSKIAKLKIKNCQNWKLKIAKIKNCQNWKILKAENSLKLGIVEVLSW